MRRSTSFNGAVASQRRKRAAGHRRHRRARGFNGAVASQRRKPVVIVATSLRREEASMEPSPLSDGNLWGGLPAAEWVISLQWSRRLSATETKLRPLTTDGAAKLQWSRRLSATETRGVRARDAGANACFNGAVASQR